MKLKLALALILIQSLALSAQTASIMGRLLITPSAKNAKYILVLQEQEIDPNVMYAMICATSSPTCNNVYRSVEHYIPFKTKEEAIEYLNSSVGIFVCLFETHPIEVIEEKNTITIKHPDTEVVIKQYKVK